MEFTDFSKLGFFPLQDHAHGQDNTPLSARFMLAGGRISRANDAARAASPADAVIEYGKENGLGTLGDVHPWLFWQTRERGVRGMGSWAQVFAAVAIDADGRYGTADMQPLRDEDLRNDTRYAPKRPQWPACFPRIPRGAMFAVLPGTEEASQVDLALWADPRLVAPNARGPGECGTLVVDLQPTSELCMDNRDTPGQGGRHARLQSLVRVIAVPPQQSFADLGGTGNVLALNFTRSGADGIPGFGAFFARVDTRSAPSGPLTPGGGPSQPSGPTAPGGSTHGVSIGPGSFGDAANAGGDTEKTPKQFGAFEPTLLGDHGIGLMAHVEAFGPLHAGARNDKHNHGRDRDGHPINAAHISTDAYFYRDAEKDAPIFFEADYPHPSPLPIPAPAHIAYDGTSQHGFRDGVRPGFWRLWCETPDVTPTEEPPGVPVQVPPPITSPRGPTTPGGPGPGRPVPGPGPTTGGPRAPAPGPGTPRPGRTPGRGVPRPGAPRPPLTQPITPNPGGKRFPGHPPTSPTGGPITPGGGPQQPGTGGTPGGGPVTPGGGGSGGQPSIPCTDPAKPTTQTGHPAQTGNHGAGPGPGGEILPGRGRGSGGGDYRTRNDIVQRGASLPAERRSFGLGEGEIVPLGGMGRGSGGTAPTDPRIDLARWSGQSQTTRAPQVLPGVVERVGYSHERRGVYTILRPMAQGFAGLNFRPQLSIAGYPNFLHDPQLPAPLFFHDERRRPQVLAAHAWGAQADGEFAYTERPEAARARGGTANGGIVFHPPRFELDDYLGVGPSVLDVTDTTSPEATAAYVLAAPGVAFALGLPTTAGGLAANAVTIAQGAATTRPLEIEHNGAQVLRAYDDGTDVIVELGRGGHAAIAIPAGTTAQRPATPASGMVRLNTTSGYLEYYDGASWVSATGGGGAPTTADYLVKTANGSLSAERVVTDTATITWDWSTGGQAKANAAGYLAELDALGAGAGAGTLAVFDGSNWQMLAPGTSGQILKIDGSGVPAWSAP